MRKTYLFIYILLITIGLAACSKNNNTFNNEIRSLDFTQDCSIYSLDIGDSENTNHSIILKGTISDTALEENIIQKVESIELNGDENTINVLSSDINWNFYTEEDSKRYFSLELTNINLNNEFTENINYISFNNSSDKIQIELEDFFVQAYRYIDNRVSIIESPISPKNGLKRNDESICSYNIMSFDNSSAEDIKIKLEYPEAINSYIKMNEIRTSRNIEMEDMIKEEYSSKLSAEDRKLLRVYQVDCFFQITNGTNIVFQPLLTYDNNGNKQNLIPLVPLQLTLQE